MARCLLIEANLPKYLWNYAVRAAAYIRNRCYCPRIAKTPFEMLTSKKPNLENMHLFGSRCYTYIEDKRKLDPRYDEGIFVGHDPTSPAYLVYYPEEDKLRKVRLVKFTDKIPNNDKSDYETEYCWRRGTLLNEGTETEETDDANEHSLPF